MTEKLITEKLKESDEYANHTGAVVMDAVIKAVKTRYDENLLDERAKILFELAKIEYNRDNISMYAKTDIAKQKKIHHHLNYRKEDIVKAVLKLFHSV